MSRIGKTVLYTLSEQDVKEIIERRRLVGAAIARGNTPTAGQEYPAIILGDWGGSANLRVFLDGYDEHWATSRPEWTENRKKAIYYAVDEDGEESRLSYEQSLRVQHTAHAKPTYQGKPVRIEYEETHEFTWRERPTAEGS